MKFLCIGFFDAGKMSARPKHEIDALMARCQPHLDKLYAAGALCDIGVSNEGKILKRVNGSLTVTDLDRHDEMIGGAFLLEAGDMDEAIKVASLHPATQIPEGEELGWHTEIRRVYTFQLPGGILR